MLEQKVKDIMTTEIVIVHPEDTMDKVDHIFRTNPIHHIPVVNEEGEILGIISKKDYLFAYNSFELFRKEVEEEKNIQYFRSIAIHKVMTRQVATLAPEDNLVAAYALFKENLFSALPIVDQNGVLIGIITTFDLLKFAFNNPLALKMGNT